MTIQWLNINGLLESVNKWEDFSMKDKAWNTKEYSRYDLWIAVMGNKMLVNKFIEKWNEFKLDTQKMYSFPISAWARSSTKKTDENWKPILYVTYKISGNPIEL